jgi:hypothetical protein
MNARAVSRVFSVLALASLLWTVAATGRAGTEPLDSAASDSTLVLTIQPNPDEAGFPEILATITNDGKSAVTLVTPGDGSFMGRRTPRLSWLVADADGNPVVRGPLVGCGNINALRAGEVFELHPGESADLVRWLGGPYLETGVYRVRLRYENDPSLVWGGIPLGDHDAAEMKRVRASTRCNLVSNEIVFEVR